VSVTESMCSTWLDFIFFSTLKSVIHHSFLVFALLVSWIIRSFVEEIQFFFSEKQKKFTCDSKTSSWPPPLFFNGGLIFCITLCFTCSICTDIMSVDSKAPRTAGLIVDGYYATKAIRNANLPAVPTVIQKFLQSRGEHLQFENLLFVTAQSDSHTFQEEEKKRIYGEMCEGMYTYLVLVCDLILILFPLAGFEISDNECQYKRRTVKGVVKGTSGPAVEIEAMMQQGVDVYITIRAMMMASKGNLRDFFLLAGDGDFIPLLKVLRLQNLRVWLIGSSSACVNVELRSIVQTNFIDLDLLFDPPKKRQKVPSKTSTSNTHQQATNAVAIPQPSLAVFPDQTLLHTAESESTILRFLQNNHQQQQQPQEPKKHDVPSASSSVLDFFPVQHTKMVPSFLNSIRRPCHREHKCMLYDCKFLHPPTRVALCKYGSVCNRMDCRFIHPPDVAHNMKAHRDRVMNRFPTMQKGCFQGTKMNEHANQQMNVYLQFGDNSSSSSADTFFSSPLPVSSIKTNLE